MTTRREASLLVAAGLASLGPVAASAGYSGTGNGASDVLDLSLDGLWEAGLDRKYDRNLAVPGLATDPAKPTSGTLWYRRIVSIPAGAWTHATLILKGARFAPQICINGVEVSRAEGGMAATRHAFDLPAGAVGDTLLLEIALRSMNDLDPQDASMVPEADRWRSNVSSCLWDSVVLRLRGDGEILRLAPTSDLKADTVAIAWRLASLQPGTVMRVKLIGTAGRVVAETSMRADGKAGSITLYLRGQVEPWTPETPRLYRLRAELIKDGRLFDAIEQSFGHRQFAVEGLGFVLNDRPYPIRMGSVVWHRWTRDPEARQIAFDTAWFERNVIARLKALGANALRFHLGLPPEALLDLCDRHGLAVQMEWPFFHGIAASKESMTTQWAAWLDAAARHPSVVLIQPWNETDGEQLRIAREALYPLLDERPPLVVCHRDVIPVHKYWWSLFENLGLYYDSADQFAQPIMSDEFGGNYLDGVGDPGLYPMTREAFVRFLGRDHTREERLQLHSDSNARVAEYWRRLGAAGFSPFCILGSPQDGSHWYLGRTDVPSPQPKPVWSALSAAYARQSISLEMWNRNFAPGEQIQVPLWLLNDADRDEMFSAAVHIVDSAGRDMVPPVRQNARLTANARVNMPIELTLPTATGEWRIEARLDAPRARRRTPPVCSMWNVRTLKPRKAQNLVGIAIGVPDDEHELRAMLLAEGCHVVAATASEARVIVGGAATWAALAASSGGDAITKSHAEGRAIVLLDAGPAPLGVGYEAGKSRGGPLEGAPVVSSPRVLQKVTLFGGIDFGFTETAEPESSAHAPEVDAPLWRHLPRAATQLWNGLRGGLIVPAADMQVSGLGGQALLALWAARGADTLRIKRGPYHAYDLAGYFAFASAPDDAAVREALRKRVKFLVEDAPALAISVNPNAPINVTDLHRLYTSSAQRGRAESVTPLALAGKNLSRTPVVHLTFAEGRGTVIVSQLITAGRMIAPNGHAKLYEKCRDPAAVQMVLNMIAMTAIPGSMVLDRLRN